MAESRFTPIRKGQEPTAQHVLELQAVLRAAATGNTGDVLTKQEDGSLALEAPAGGDLSGYQLRSEKATPGGYAGLGANTLVPVEQLGTGTPGATVALFGDQQWKEVTFPNVHVHVWQEDHTADCDGAETAFATAETFLAGSTCVWLNGLLQRPGEGNDYTEDSDGEGITFTVAPESGDVLILAYVTGQITITPAVSGPYDPAYGTLGTLVTLQLHCHTTGSDGSYTPAQVVAYYAAAGYGALMLSDHDAVTSQPAGITTAITGSELSPSTGHILSINSDYSRGSVTDRQTEIDAVVADGGRAVIAHPLWGAGVPYDQMAALQSCLGMELHNAVCVGGAGGFDVRAYPGFAVARWDSLLANIRQDVWGFASDDLHDITALRGYDVGRNIVFVAANTLTDIMTSLLRGCFVADVSNFGVTPGYPDVTSTGVSLTCTGATSIRFLGATGLLREIQGATAVYAFTGAEKYVRIEAVGDYTEGFGSDLDWANRWGVSGGAWSVSSGALHQATAGAGPYWLILKRHIQGDIDITCDLTVTSTSGAGRSAGVLFNCLTTANTYYLQLCTEGADQGLNWQRVVGGVAAKVAGHSFAAADNTAYSVRLQYTAATGALKARVWAVGDAEPVIWHIDAVDANLGVGGALGFRASYACDIDNYYVKGFKTYYQPLKITVSGGEPAPEIEDTYDTSLLSQGSTYTSQEERITAKVDMVLTKVKYRSPSSGTHTCTLKAWDESVIAGPITVSGTDWMQFTLPSPVSLTALTSYKVAFTKPSGRVYRSTVPYLYDGTLWKALSTLYSGGATSSATAAMGLIAQG